MRYEWSSLLETGHETIDSQHKEIFAAVNSFAEACENGKGKEEIEKTLAFLVEYTKKHFQDEENIQREYNFPDYERHRRAHLDFFKKVHWLVGRYQVEGPTEALLREILTTVGDWLLHHIKSDDFVVAAFVRQS